MDAPEYNQKKTYKFNLSTYGTPESLSLSPILNEAGRLVEKRKLGRFIVVFDYSIIGMMISVTDFTLRNIFI